MDEHQQGDYALIITNHAPERLQNTRMNSPHKKSLVKVTGGTRVNRMK